VASTNLRLLLDESITEPLASSILGMVPSAKFSKESIGQGATDGAVVALANRDRRIIVAMDSDFKHYVIEWGVIKLNRPDRADDACLFAIFKAFWQSGFRIKARKRRTSLSNDGARIKNGESFEHRWNPRPCPNR
jgi:hypothetical protein